MKKKLRLSNIKHYCALDTSIFLLFPMHVISVVAQEYGSYSLSVTSEFKSQVMQVGKGTELNHKYIKNILQKLIVSVESTSDIVVEDLYEKFAYYLTIQLVTSASSASFLPSAIHL